MDLLLDFLVLITTMTVFLMVMRFKHPIKRVVFLYTLFIGVSFSLYLYLYGLGFEKELLSGLCFSLPSLLLAYMLSYYKGARFIFTFAMVDLLGMLAIILGRSISLPFDRNPAIIFISTGLLLGFYVWSASRIRKQYLTILDQVTKGWSYMGLTAIFLYVFTLVLVGYPSPLYIRQEYILTLMVYLLVFFSFLKVMYESAKNNIKIYNDKLEKDYLQVQLELAQAYHDMAYKDGLTGINNRRAYEETLDKMEGDGLDVACLSLDLNNLKYVNDHFGHHAGDLLIQTIGDLLVAVFEPETCYRVGGDEFMVIIQKETGDVLKDLLDQLDQKTQQVQENLDLPFDYALGMTCGKGENIRHLIREADQIMYQGKKEKKKMS